MVNRGNKVVDTFAHILTRCHSHLSVFPRQNCSSTASLCLARSFRSIKYPFWGNKCAVNITSQPCFRYTTKIDRITHWFIFQLLVVVGDPCNESTLEYPSWRQTLSCSFTPFYLAILTQILVKPRHNSLKAAKPLFEFLVWWQTLPPVHIGVWHNT